MQKIWQSQYEDGVPTEINPEEFSSLVELLLSCCQQYADNTAFIHLSTKMSYAELHSYSTQFAACLQHHYQLSKQDRIIIMLPNILSYPVCLFGALMAGLIVVNVNPMYTASELAQIITNSGAKAIVILENINSVLSQLKDTPMPKHIINCGVGALHPAFKAKSIHFMLSLLKKMPKSTKLPNAITIKQALAFGKQHAFKPVKVTATDIAFLQYTGGTTGAPKAAMLSHSNMVANIEQAYVWVKSHFEENKTIVTALPLYHIFSLMANCLLFMRMGGTNILITDPRDLNYLIKQLKRYQFSAITGVNTLFNALNHHPKFCQLDFTNMRLSLGGGMPVHESVATKWQHITGKPLIEAYGLTEASPAVCINPMSIKAFNHSVGLPIPSTEIDIRDEQGNTVPINTPGELYVKGPQVMGGYWQDQIETKTVLKQGWLKTGDIVQIDEQGFVYIVDRKKEMILVSGFNVYSKEVESVITTHPRVLEAAVIGVPDTASGEAVKAFIVKKHKGLTKAEIKQHCVQALTAYKVPHQIEFIESLPKNHVGKVLKRQLK